MAKENAMKRNSKTCSIEQKVKTRTKVNKTKHTRPISLEDRAAQASTRSYQRIETQLREPNVTG